jgi:chromate transport protein ChrA
MINICTRNFRPILLNHLKIISSKQTVCSSQPSTWIFMMPTMAEWTLSWWKTMTYPEEIYKEICLVFARLGLFAFGGPAAHIAMMEDELVTKRKWLTKTDFMDLIGFTNLIPGPNSTELAIAMGYKRGGKIGLFLAGICFIFPAMTIVLLLAMFYKEYGEVPLIEAIFTGIKPVIVAVIIQAHGITVASLALMASVS